MVRSKIFRLGLIHFRLKFPKAIKGHARILLVPSQSLHFIGWSTDKPSILRNKKNIKGSSKNLGLGSVVKIQEHVVNPALLIMDMQNGFVSKGGSYDLMGIDTSKYLEIVPNIQDLIQTCSKAKIPFGLDV